jgi:hypothetical protein
MPVIVSVPGATYPRTGSGTDQQLHTSPEFALIIISIFFKGRHRFLSGCPLEKH